MRGGLEILEPASTRVLDHHAETTCRADALDRGRAKGDDDCFGDFVEPRPQLREDRVGCQVGRLSFIEPVEHNDRGAGIRLAAAAQHGESVDEQARVYAWRVLEDREDFIHHNLGTLKRGGVGQLGIHDQIALVLLGNKARRRDFETVTGERKQADIEDQANGDLPHETADGLAVLPASPIERAVEAPEEPSECAVEEAGQPVLRRVVAAQEQHAERGAECKRVHSRDGGGHRDRQRELPEKLSGDAGNERRRHEHRRKNDSNRNYRTAHLAHGLPRRIARRHAETEFMLDRLDDHDGVVHDDTDGQHETEE